MKLSFRCDTTYFRECMRRPMGGPTTVGVVWQALSIAFLAVTVLMSGALFFKSVSMCCIAFAILGVAFSMILPRES